MPGDNGSGDTAIGRNIYFKAPEMRLAPAQSMIDAEIYYTTNGIRLTAMPARGERQPDGPVDEDKQGWLAPGAVYSPPPAAQRR